MESAMTSRDTSEYRMPGEPMEMPSDTVMVFEQHALAPCRIHALRRGTRQLGDMHIARREIGPGGGNADLRLAEIGIGETHRAQHGARGSLLRSIHDQSRIAAWILGRASPGSGFDGHSPQPNFWRIRLYSERTHCLRTPPDGRAVPLDSRHTDQCAAMHAKL